MIPILDNAAQAIDYLASGLEDPLLTVRIEEYILVTSFGMAVLIESELSNNERRYVIYYGDD